MKSLLPLFLSLSFLLDSTDIYSQLIPVQHKNKFGYIDTTGKMIVPPIFYEARPFSEGLAAVRHKGSYGYINSKSIYIIAPQYDYAESFSEGMARVYKNGSSIFIDKSKKKLFEVPNGIKEMQAFKNNLSIVKGTNGFSGIMNNQGQLLVDTVYYTLEDIGGKQYIACLFDPAKGDTTLANDYWLGSDALNYPPDYGVINSVGDTLIQFGKYIDINKSGKSTILCRGSKSVKHYYIDIYNQDYQLIYSYENDLPYFSAYSFESGDYIISRPNNEYGKSMGYSHYVLLNKKGEVILDKPEFEQIRTIPFKNKMFVKIKGESFGVNTYYRLVNLKGEFLDERRYISIVDDETFGNPLLVYYNLSKTIYTNKCWCSLDSDLKITPIDGLCIRGWGFEVEKRKNLYVISNDDEDNIRMYGWLKTLNENRPASFPLPAKPLIWEGGATLISSSTDTSEVVYTTDGNMIYSFKNTYKKYKYNLDKKVMMRFKVHGWEHLFMHSVTDWLPNPQKDLFHTTDFITVTSEVKNFGAHRFDRNFDKYLERRIIVSNKNKKNTLACTTVGENNELVLILEAFNDQNKKWMPISYVDSKKDTLVKKLQPGYCWQLFIPEMKGEVKTSLRVKIEVLNSETGKPEFLYSKPYLGSINPGQFWQKDASGKFWSCPEYKFRVFDE